MPIYNFRNKETGEETTEMMKISELDEFKANNPHLQQYLTGAPSLGDSVRLGLRRHDQNFNDVLKNIKSHHKHSTIETR
jgi:hypothetical protein